MTGVSLQNKDSINNKNHYNHNFKGLYCTCRKPYPDPDDSQPDEMAQCVLCEDWFHFKVPRVHIQMGRFLFIVFFCFLSTWARPAPANLIRR